MTSDCILKKVLGIYEKINPRLIQGCPKSLSLAIVEYWSEWSIGVL